MLSSFALKRSSRDQDPPIIERIKRQDPTSRLILTEAQRRGLDIQVIDADRACFRLSRGARSIRCHESLTELTTQAALARCEDKRVTSRILRDAGLSVPDQREADGLEQSLAFLAQHGTLAVKPANGEQGSGVSVGIRTPADLTRAIALASAVGTPVLLEQAVSGVDLRMVVIDYKVSAAAVRRPPRVVGNGKHTVAQLIEQESARRSRATAGASTIPVDAETERCVREAGYEFDSVLTDGTELVLRGAANVHTGGTIEDVTSEVSSSLVATAERAARVLEIPVVGIDMIVPSIFGTRYWILEANERPGFANHEPEPVAERFLDFLFPDS